MLAIQRDKNPMGKQGRIFLMG